MYAFLLKDVWPIVCCFETHDKVLLFRKLHGTHKVYDKSKRVFFLHALSAPANAYMISITWLSWLAVKRPENQSASEGVAAVLDMGDYLLASTNKSEHVETASHAGARPLNKRRHNRGHRVSELASQSMPAFRRTASQPGSASYKLFALPSRFVPNTKQTAATTATYSLADPLTPSGPSLHKGGGGGGVASDGLAWLASSGNQHLRLYQILVPELAARALCFGNQLALKDGWEWVLAPYFSAPGERECMAGIWHSVLMFLSSLVLHYGSSGIWVDRGFILTHHILVIHGHVKTHLIL